MKTGGQKERKTYYDEGEEQARGLCSVYKILPISNWSFQYKITCPETLQEARKCYSHVDKGSCEQPYLTMLSNKAAALPLTESDVLPAHKDIDIL